MKSGVALLSIAVLLVTGYAWSNYSEFQRGLNTGNLTAQAGPDGALDILLVGMDSRTDAQGRPLSPEVLSKLRAGKNDAQLTDTLILLHVPEDGSRAVAFSFPRDAYVPIPDGHGSHKINSAFGRGKRAAMAGLRAQRITDSAELERRSSHEGRKLMLRTVEQLAGVSIDHYAEVNLLGFYEITNAVGGVPVCLKDSVDDPYSGADFDAGVQTISGSDALAFVRQRHGLPRGDLDRVVRQQAFLAGLTSSMLTGGLLTSPSKLSKLIESVQASIVLDDGWDVMSFVQRLEGLAGGAITFGTVPIQDPDFRSPDGAAVKIDPAAVRQAIHSVRNGRSAPVFNRMAPDSRSAEAGSPDESGAVGSSEKARASDSSRPSKTAKPSRETDSSESAGTSDESEPSKTYKPSRTRTPSRTSAPTRNTESSTTARPTETSTSTETTTDDPPPAVSPRQPVITADGVSCVN